MYMEIKYVTHASIRNKAHFLKIDLMKELNAMNVVEHINIRIP